MGNRLCVCEELHFLFSTKSVTTKENSGAVLVVGWRTRYALVGRRSFGSMLGNGAVCALAQIDVIWAGHIALDKEVGIYRLLKTIAGAAGVGASAVWFAKRREIVGAGSGALPWGWSGGCRRSLGSVLLSWEC